MSASVPPHERALARVLATLERDDADGLAEALYQRFFIGWREPARPRVDFAGDSAFVAELASRTGHAHTWQPGFVVEQRTPSGVFVLNDDIRLWVTNTGDLRPRAARRGQRVAVRLPCARESALPGFFTVVSRAGRLPAEAPNLRLYLHAAPAAVAPLLEGLVSAPALRTARFEVKVGNEPSHFGRRDTAVLYVAPRDFRRVAAWVLAFRRRHARHFRRETPPLTWPLAPGVAAAESPATDESFGAHRCRLIAEAVVSARGDWRGAVRERFAREGLDWARPWLGRLRDAWARSGARAPSS